MKAAITILLYYYITILANIDDTSDFSIACQRGTLLKAEFHYKVFADANSAKKATEMRSVSGRRSKYV